MSTVLRIKCCTSDMIMVVKNHITGDRKVKADIRATCYQ